MRSFFYISIQIILITALFTFCNGHHHHTAKSHHAVPSSNIISKEAKKAKRIDRKALKQQIKLQAKKRKELDKLENKDRTPTQLDKQKKGTPKSPETFY